MALRTTARPLMFDIQARIGLWSGDTPPPQYQPDHEFSVEITPPSMSTVRVIGRTIDSLGESLLSARRPSGEVAQVKIMTTTYSPAVMALALGAAVSEVDVTATPVADQAITTVLGLWVPVYDGPIGTVSLDIDGAVATDKYQVDTALGMLRAIHADAVGTGTVSYTPAARTYEQYAAGAAVDSYWHLTGRARNVDTGMEGTLDLWRCNLVPDGAITVPTGESAFEASLSGDLVTPAVAVRGYTPTSPWRFRDRIA
jgi:hypothetical protein